LATVAVPVHEGLTVRPPVAAPNVRGRSVSAGDERYLGDAGALPEHLGREAATFKPGCAVTSR
jgi:hypothetical protein